MKRSISILLCALMSAFVCAAAAGCDNIFDKREKLALPECVLLDDYVFQAQARRTAKAAAFLACCIRVSAFRQGFRPRAFARRRAEKTDLCRLLYIPRLSPPPRPAAERLTELSILTVFFAASYRIYLAALFYHNSRRPGDARQNSRFNSFFRRNLSEFLRF